MAGRPPGRAVSCVTIWLPPQVVLHAGLAEHLAQSPNSVTCQLPISAPAHDSLQPAGHTVPHGPPAGSGVVGLTTHLSRPKAHYCLAIRPGCNHLNVSHPRESGLPVCPRPTARLTDPLAVPSIGWKTNRLNASPPRGTPRCVQGMLLPTTGRLAPALTGRPLWTLLSPGETYSSPQPGHRLSQPGTRSPQWVGLRTRSGCYSGERSTGGLITSP